MAKIKYLKDKQGSVVYPITHERAVKDRNGILLEDKLRTMLTYRDMSLSNYEYLANHGLCDSSTFYYVFDDITGDLLKICIGDTEIQGGGSDPDAVKYTEQELTDAQKVQARENIGACSATEASGSAQPSSDTSVKYTVQNLTSAQKVQARTNIGAGTSSFSGSYNDLQDKPEQIVLSQNVIADKNATGKAPSSKSFYEDVHPAIAYSQPDGGMLPNVYYDLGVLDGGNITFLLAAPLDASVVNHYFFVFRTGENVPNVTWPSNIIGWINGGDPELEPLTHYEISIINGYAAYLYI